MKNNKQGNRLLAADGPPQISHYIPLGPRLLRRLAALLYDTLLILAIWLVIGALAVLFNQGQAVTGNSRWLLLLALVLAPLVFFSWFWRQGGQTLGMRAWQLKLVANEQQQPSWFQCLVRCLVALVSLLCFGLGYWWIWISPERLTWHDYLSHTHLIQINRAPC